MANKSSPRHMQKIETRAMAIATGPLPVSKEFAGYEEVLPGAAERILALAEKEAIHRHANENDIIKESVKIKRRGQIFALIVIFLSLCIIAFSIFKEQPVGAIAPTLIALTGLASVFFNNQK